MKVADVRLYWTPSLSSDIAKQVVNVTIGDSISTFDLLPGAVEHRIEVTSNSSFSFSVDSIDVEGNRIASVTYSSNVGDLEVPLPATDLGSEIMGVREVELPTP